MAGDHRKISWLHLLQVERANRRQITFLYFLYFRRKALLYYFLFELTFEASTPLIFNKPEVQIGEIEALKLCWPEETMTFCIILYSTPHDRLRPQLVSDKF